MKIVIVGAGRTGVIIAERLVKENHDITLVDINFQAVEAAINRLDVNGVAGNAFERNVLVEADVPRCDCFFACTSSDEINILCCSLAKKMGAKNVIARVCDSHYTTSYQSMQDDLGLDMIFNPKHRTAMEIAGILQFPSAISTDVFAGGKVILSEFLIPENCAIVSKTVADIMHTYNSKVLFALVNRGGKTFIPKGDFVIEAKDVVHIAAEEAELAAFCKKIRIFKQPAKSVIISGGGNIGYYLAKELLSKGVNVKMVEKDKARCEQLDEELSRLTVICADAAEEGLLDEEGIADCDAFVALTGMDEKNAVLSLYAANAGVDKVITKITAQNIAKMVKKLGLDTVLSPKELTGDALVRFVRAKESANGNGVNALYRIGERAEALEFTATDNFPKLNVPLKDLKLKSNTLLFGIVRAGNFILPTGGTALLCGDKVLVITLKGQISVLEQILK